MASLLSPRRTDVELRLHASAPADPDAGRTPPEGDGLRVGWLPAGVVGAVLCLVATWLLVAGVTVVGWLAGPGDLPGALATGTRLWLAGAGVGVRLGPLDVTLVPWGVTALSALLVSRAAAFAARSARREQDPRPWPVALVVVGTFVVPVLVLGAVEGRMRLAPGHLTAVVAVLLVAALLGAARALSRPLTRSWPRWLRPVPRAALGAQAVLLAAGAAVTVTGIVVHLDRVTALQRALQPGVTGTIALVAAQLALLPNAFVWAASYALGGGFTLGGGSVVAPAGTDLGVLPGLPVLGALPAEGPGPTSALWWLAAGVLAGAVAAWLVVRARPDARFDETALVGGLSGLVGGLVFVGLAWATSGGLGTVRLSHLGPLLLPLLVMAVTTLGLSGMVTGLVLGLWRRRSRGSAGQDTDHRDLDRAEDEREHARPEPGEERTEVLRPPVSANRPEGSR